MQWVRRLMLGGVIGVLASMAALSWPASAEQRPSREVVRLTIGEWPPFTSKSVANYGVASAIVTSSFQAVGIHVEWGFFPWQRAYHMSKIGLWDGSVGWIKTPEREADFLYSDPVITDPYYVYSKQSAPLEWEVISDLDGHSFALEYITAYPTLHDSLYYNRIRASRVTKYKSMLPMVMAGRVDATIMSEGNAEYYLRQNPEWQKKIYKDKTPLNVLDYHMIITRISPHGKYMIGRFNVGLYLIKANGTYAEILEKWQRGYYD